MISSMKKIFQCLTSPRLYNVHREGPAQMLYEPNVSEGNADILISMFDVFRGMSYYVTPFIGLFIYKRGFFDAEESKTLVICIGGLGAFLALTFLIRAVSRARNPAYLQFLQALNSKKDDLPAYIQKMQKYDFDFQAWPATYVIPYNPESVCWDRPGPFVSKESAHLRFYQKCIVKFLAYIAINTFALRLIYPGSLGILQFFLWNTICQGRAGLVSDHQGQRAKIVAADGNSIDTMFVDKRSKSSRGNILVICSEGNTGFYEIGIMGTPLQTGYSALGYNHPGFGGSTGLPYPRQEHFAIDAVMQYAINRLLFQPHEIVMFGWSIGGYSASWAAVNYRTKALILDATFDDLVPMAVDHMPPSWEPVVKEVIRKYVDLNVAEMTKHYRGPLHFIRRTKDEVICSTQGDISTNRGNDLLVKIINHRHAEEVEELLDELVTLANLPAKERPKIDDPSLTADMRRVLSLINKYSTDFDSTHCSPLPSEKFEDILARICTEQLPNRYL